MRDMQYTSQAGQEESLSRGYSGRDLKDEKFMVFVCARMLGEHAPDSGKSVPGTPRLGYAPCV